MRRIIEEQQQRMNKGNCCAVLCCAVLCCAPCSKATKEHYDSSISISCIILLYRLVGTVRRAE